MSRTMTSDKFAIKLPVMRIKKPFRLEQPVVMIPEEEYRGLMEDIADLRDALKSEEEYLSSGGRLFIEYDQKRRKHE